MSAYRASSAAVGSVCSASMVLSFGGPGGAGARFLAWGFYPASARRGTLPAAAPHAIIGGQPTRHVFASPPPPEARHTPRRPAPAVTRRREGSERTRGRPPEGV